MTTKITTEQQAREFEKAKALVDILKGSTFFFNYEFERPGSALNDEDRYYTTQYKGKIIKTDPNKNEVTVSSAGGLKPGEGEWVEIIPYYKETGGHDGFLTRVELELSAANISYKEKSTIQMKFDEAPFDLQEVVVSRLYFDEEDQLLIDVYFLTDATTGTYNVSDWQDVRQNALREKHKLSSFLEGRRTQKVNVSSKKYQQYQLKPSVKEPDIKYWDAQLMNVTGPMIIATDVANASNASNASNTSEEMNVSNVSNAANVSNVSTGSKKEEPNSHEFYLLGAPDLRREYKTFARFHTVARQKQQGESAKLLRASTMKLWKEHDINERKRTREREIIKQEEKKELELEKIKTAKAKRIQELKQQSGKLCPASKFGCLKLNLPPQLDPHHVQHLCDGCNVDTCAMPACSWEKNGNTNTVCCTSCWPLRGGVPSGCVTPENMEAYIREAEATRAGWKRAAEQLAAQQMQEKVIALEVSTRSNRKMVTRVISSSSLDSDSPSSSSDDDDDFRVGEQVYFWQGRGSITTAVNRNDVGKIKSIDRTKATALVVHAGSFIQSTYKLKNLKSVEEMHQEEEEMNMGHLAKADSDWEHGGADEDGTSSSSSSSSCGSNDSSKRQRPGTQPSSSSSVASSSSSSSSFSGSNDSNKRQRRGKQPSSASSVASSSSSSSGSNDSSKRKRPGTQSSSASSVASSSGSSKICLLPGMKPRDLDLRELTSTRATTTSVPGRIIDMLFCCVCVKLRQEYIVSLSSCAISLFKLHLNNTDMYSTLFSSCRLHAKNLANLSLRTYIR